MINLFCLFKIFNYVSVNHSDQTVWKSSVSELNDYYYGSRTVTHARFSVVMEDVAPEPIYFSTPLSKELDCSRNAD